MIELDADCERRSGVTYVRARLTNGRGTPQEVRLRPTLDGPVWAPVSGPVVSPEWNDGTWSGVLAPGETRGVGFATPAEPVDDPLEVAAVDRASETDDGSDADRVLTELEASAPPTDAIPRDR